MRPSNQPKKSATVPVAVTCDFSFLIPTRNNLPGLKKLFDSIVATTSNPRALEIVLAMDEDDQASQSISDSRLQLRKIVVPKGLTMGKLNNACYQASSGRYLMLMNDDVVLRTPGWDRQVFSVFAGFRDEIALVHVNDLLFRERLCTFPILSRRACEAIGVCPTAYKRYRIDDHIYDTYNLLAHLGYRRIVYLPEVIFEHENHESEAAPAGNHQFASEDKKVYVPKAGIIEQDAKYCDDHFSDRKAAALKLAGLIEADAHRRAVECLEREGAARLASVADSHSYRRPAYLQTRATTCRNSQNARTTVAVVTADVNGEVARQCVAAIKQHTRNYDLVILDNNRGFNFSHPREMNRVLDGCANEFLVLLDDDVFVEPGWLDGLLGCVDEETGVVVPLHKDRKGELSFSGIYFAADGKGSHAHTLDRPTAPRVVQSYCSAAMLIDMRKCGHIRMDEAYHKYFFDLVHGFEVWEAGWKAVCCPTVTVTHLGGATMTWGSAEANACLEKDRAIFVRGWIENGRLARLKSGAWQRHPYLTQLEELPQRIEKFLARASSLSRAQFEEQLSLVVKACAPFKLLTHQLLAGLALRIQTFANKGDIQRILLSCQLAAASDGPLTEIHWLLTAIGPLFDAKQFQLAEKLLLSGLERHATEVALWRALGISRFKQGTLQEARSAFEQAIVHSPGDIDSQHGLGATLFRLQLPSEAADRLEEALRLCQKADPKDPRIRIIAENLATARQLAPKPVAPPAPQNSVQGRFSRQSAPLTSASSLGTSAPVATSQTAQRFSHTKAEPQNEKTPIRRPKILLIPFECANWQNARAWSYNGYFAFEEGLQAAGVDFVTIPAIAGFPSDHPASWLNYARELCNGQQFDQAWVWLTHNDYHPGFFDWLAATAPVRVGVIMESMQHTTEEFRSYPLLPGRQERVATMLRHMTHVLAFDEADADSFAADLPLSALWCPPVVPARCLCPKVELPPPGPAIFNGTIYSPERRSFFEHPKLRQKLIQPALPEDQTELPARFDAAQLRALNMLGGQRGASFEQLVAHVAEIRQVRRQLFDLWLQALQAGYASVNLPSVYKGYAGRVVESMAAGRPVVSWAPPRARTRALFTPDKEILLFDRKSPVELHKQIDRLQKDPVFARTLAEAGREKVRRYHTAEVRVRQILDWIEHDTQPDYGEGNLPSASMKAPRGNAEVLAEAELAVERSPEAADRWARLARSAVQAGRIERFDAALRRALELNPMERNALKLLGDLCVREGQLKNAVQHYYKLLQANPNDRTVLYGLGSTLEQAGEWEVAFQVYDQLMRVCPQDQVLATRVSRLRKARGHALPEPVPAPVVVSSEPSLAPAALNPSCSSSTPEHHSPARVQNSAKPLPACAHIAQLAQGRTLFANKEFQDAWQFTLKAIASRPYHPEAFLLLAEIALAAGDSASATRCAHQARDFAPNWKPAKKFLKGNLRGNTRSDWLVLPEAFDPARAPKLSVCLIARNEEKFLGQCLESVRGLADQIVVLDTGSTDRTIEIAKEHGAEIHHFTWIDDFSAARNAALEHARGDWVLILDADEELPSDQHATLKLDLKGRNTIALRLPLVNRGQEAEGCSFVPRLFRNAPGVYFTSRVHEQVFPSLVALGKSWGLVTGLGKAQILHHGYSKETLKDRNKIERNLNLLHKAVQEDPDDANLEMNLGLELVRSNDLQGGLPHYRRAFELLSAQRTEETGPELREALLTQFTCHLYKVQRYQEVIEVLTSPLAARPGLSASLHFALGLAYFGLSRYSEAAEQMLHCLAKRSQRALTPANTDIFTAAPNHCLAMSLAKGLDIAGAEKAFQAGLNDKGHTEVLCVDYAKFLVDQDRAVDALNLLHKFTSENPNVAAAWRLGGEITLSRPEFLEVASDWTAEALKQFPDDGVMVAQRAEALLLNQHTAQARDLWKDLCQREPLPRSQAALILCQVIDQDSFADFVCEPDLGPTSRAFIDWYQRCLAMHAQALVEHVNERLDSLRSVLPAAAMMIETALTEAGAKPVTAPEPCLA
jgi:glycosyltransferase involved in cell wall biosynthesis/Flp pilus assembly protein TadD